jgi:hypothetical protein
MRVFREPEESFGSNALTFALGAAGGLAIGMLLSRRVAPPRVGRLGSDLRERARAAGARAGSVARRLRPARLRRLAGEQAELTTLEDQVLDAFLADSVLSERGIDVGAISAGIVELSGSVWTHDEADRAVALANSLPGVRTVVNRMEIEQEVRQLERTRSQFDDDDAMGETRWTGRMVGMNRRRQGKETEPDRPDDSQIQEAEALRRADIEQWQDEGLSWEQPHMAERPEVQRAGRTRYEEDELGNQDPHGKHADYTLDEQPQELNTSARVGEGLKTGTHLRLEQADVPTKPHSGNMETEGEDRDERASD